MWVIFAENAENPNTKKMKLLQNCHSLKKSFFFKIGWPRGCVHNVSVHMYGYTGTLDDHVDVYIMLVYACTC